MLKNTHLSTLALAGIFGVSLAGCEMEDVSLEAAGPAPEPLVFGELVASPALPAPLVPDGEELSMARTSTTDVSFTISGRVVYNDLREYGNFDMHDSVPGTPGAYSGYSATVDNYLGALDVVADFYEVDTAFGCAGEDYITSVTLADDGTFSKTFSVGEDCLLEDSAPEVMVSYRLRFCNSTRCVSLNDDDNNLYRLSPSTASASSPIRSGGSTALGLFRYQLSDRDVYAQAANLYASMIEGSRIFHVTEGIPFYYSTYGELKVRFPSEDTDSASTLGPDEIVVSEPSTWPNGRGVLHEYGHAIHMRSWDGTTGGCGDCEGGQYMRNGDDSWGIGEQEYPNTAFQEGLANFFMHAALGGCEGIDVNSTSSPVYSATASYPFPTSSIADGKSFPGNVTKVLCDWLDADNDNDTNFAGTGDYFAADDLYSVWYNLEDMWDWSGGADGLQLCDYVDYYVNERKSVAAVGTTAHEAAEDAIVSLIYNNAVSCDYPSP